LPSSTLFPYTTLFRSPAGEIFTVEQGFETGLVLGRGRERQQGQGKKGEGDAGKQRHGVGLRGEKVPGVLSLGGSGGPSPSFPARDRKSTRLNSSHVAI